MEYPVLRMKKEDGGFCERRMPPKRIKATVNKQIRKKYKGKADAILKFLVKMYNEYKEHIADGSSYHDAKLLWDGHAKREMTWEQKMDYLLSGYNNSG